MQALESRAEAWALFQGLSSLTLCLSQPPALAMNSRLFLASQQARGLPPLRRHRPSAETLGTLRCAPALLNIAISVCQHPYMIMLVLDLEHMEL